MAQSILIVGAYGMAGRAISRSVLNQLNCHLIITGRNAEKLERFSDQLKKEFPNKEHLHLILDATHRESLLNAMAKVEFAIIAATIPESIELIAECAAETKTNVIDLFVRNDIAERIQHYDPVFIDRNLVYFTQCGFHPGIIAPLIKYLAPFFDEYHTAKVAMAMEPVFEKPEAIQELIFELFETKPVILRQGTWIEADYNYTFDAEFSSHFGSKTCYPLKMPEIHNLDYELGLKEAGVYAAGFSTFIDYVVFPIAMFIGKFNKELAQKIGGWLMYLASRKYSADKLRVELILKASGEKVSEYREVELHLMSDDGYKLTALPIISLLKQYQELSPKPIGIHLMGETVLERPLVDDLKDAGIEIEVIIKEPTGKLQVVEGYS